MRNIDFSRGPHEPWREVQKTNGCNCGGSLYPPDQVDCKTYPCEVALLMNTTVEPSVAAADIELTQAALKACGYRTKLRERCGTQWVEAVKGLDVRYVHWHPLTNITQAMQLLIEAPVRLEICANSERARVADGSQGMAGGVSWLPDTPSAQDLINAQCRAIVMAIAGLQV